MRQSTFTKDCLRAMQYSIEDPTYRSGIVRAVGTAYHAGLEGHYRARMDQLERTTFIHDAQVDALASLNGEIERAGEHFTWDEKFPDARAAQDSVCDMLEHYFHDGREWPADWTVLGVELSFELPWWGEHTAIGTTDLVLQAPNGWVVGVDHKTGAKAWPKDKEHPRKNHQACWYTGALKRLFPDAPGWHYVFDVMTYKGGWQRLPSYPTDEHIQAANDKAMSVLALYAGMRNNGMELPTNPSSTLCSERYCDFFSTCPSGSALAG